VVIEAPMYLQRPDLGLALPCPPDLAPALADLLDLPLAGELMPGEVSEDGQAAGVRQPVPEVLRPLLPGGPEGAPGGRMAEWCEHELLEVDGVEVDWWVDDAPDVVPGQTGGVVHAATSDGLARGLAWAAGRWELRGILAQVLADPDSAGDALIDAVYGR
jgi:hypothetical protein